MVGHQKRTYGGRAAAFGALCLGLVGCAAVPTPFSDQARLTRLQGDSSLMFAGQEPLTGPVDLYEAIARGLKYNLDKRLKLMELGFADARLQEDATGMLPKVVMDAGYSTRDNWNASSSCRGCCNRHPSPPLATCPSHLLADARRQTPVP